MKQSRLRLSRCWPLTTDHSPLTTDHRPMDYTYDDIRDYLDTMNRFSTITAQQRYVQGTKFGWTDVVFRPLLRRPQTGREPNRRARCAPPGR